MTRRIVVAGNWKMNKTATEARRLILALKHKLLGIDSRAEVVVCPPFVALETAVDAARGTAIAIGAQNAFWASDGAFTGEVSAEMLEALGVTHVILGHSERRSIFGESDEMVNRKLRHVLKGRLTPIVCIGENLEERAAGETANVLERQLSGSLDGIPTDLMPRVIVAYEPVWAIGTGRTASPELANDAHALIRRKIAAMVGGVTADAVRVLYGGSVKPENARDLMAQSDIDGVLVGGASLDADSFSAIVDAAP